MEFNVAEPSFEVAGVYLAERSGQMRVDIFMGGKRVFSEGLNRSGAWQLLGDAKVGTPASAEGQKALMRGIENQLYGLHELPRRGHRLELAGRERVNDTEYFVIRLTDADQHSILRYINPDTWLIDLSREKKALHPDVDPTETVVETQYSNYQRVDGLLKPFHEKAVDLKTKEIIQTTTVNQILFNPAIDSAVFKCP